MGEGALAVILGCDDAPVVGVPTQPQPRRFTLVMPYYENPRFLVRQVENWRSYPEKLKQYLHIILVDDGSPDQPAEGILDVIRGNIYGYSLDLFRIGVDVRWNWLAARNIGAHHAPEGWVMLTDMDHMLPAATLVTLVYGRHDPGVIYRFSRTGSKTNPHPNSWFMTRAMFWRVGGYDEDASGYYGTDGSYRRRCVATAPIRIMRDELVLHEHSEDSSTTRYKRKQPEDARGKRLLEEKARLRRPPKVLSFPYKEVTW